MTMVEQTELGGGAKETSPVGPLAEQAGDASGARTGVAGGLGAPDAMRAQMEQLLKMAADYAGQALQSLVNQAEGDTEKLRDLFYNYVDLACRLEVHFLFPNLADNERLLLVGLACARKAMAVGQKNTAHYRSPNQRSQHDTAMETIKQRYLTVRAEIVSRGIARQLTPLQDLILQQEFMKLPKVDSGTVT